MKNRHKISNGEVVGQMMLPLFQQVKRYIIQQIESGEWSPEFRIPSENQIVEQFEVSRSTVTRAFRELTAEGYLVRIQGVGTFVAPRNPKYALLEIHSIANEIKRRGGKHSCDVHFLAEENVSGELAFEMGLAEGASVFHAILVHRSDGQPIQLADRYVNPSMAPDFLMQDFTKITPSEYLFQQGPLTEAEHTVEAVIPDKQIQIYLDMPEKEPCLVIHRRTWSNAIVASKVTLYHPGSKFRPRGRFKPSPRSFSEY